MRLQDTTFQPLSIVFLAASTAVLCNKTPQTKLNIQLFVLATKNLPLISCLSEVSQQLE